MGANLFCYLDNLVFSCIFALHLSNKAMSPSTKVRRIVKDIENLDHAEKLDVLSHVTAMLKKSGSNSTYSIADLKGLGKEIWQQHDIDSYLNNERDSWE